MFSIKWRRSLVPVLNPSGILGYRIQKSGLLSTPSAHGMEKRWCIGSCLRLWQLNMGWWTRTFWRPAGACSTFFRLLCFITSADIGFLNKSASVFVDTDKTSMFHMFVTFTCLFFLNHKLRVSEILLNPFVYECTSCQSKRSCVFSHILALWYFLFFFLLDWSFCMTLILAAFCTDTSSSAVPYASTFRWF